MKANFKAWQESASMILAAKTNFAPYTVGNEANYKVLMMKRTEKASFMPGAYVFPGGNISPADSSRDWMKLYEKFGFSLETFDKLKPSGLKPHIFNDDDDNDKDSLPKYLSLRISAIRETFEESGILVCRSFKINYKERLARWASFIGGHEIVKWQKIVHNDPNQFINLCSQFEVYPDVWALKLWSNWMTPMHLPRKFNTVFFLTAFDQMAPAHPEKKEIVHLQWQAPSTYLSQSTSGEILMPPPQFYEISRLTPFLDISYLSKFGAERSVYGCECYFPYRIGTDEGVVSILPGDDLYPKDVNVIMNETMSYTKRLPYTNVQNRIVHEGTKKHRVITENFTPKCHHAPPLSTV